MEASPLPLHPEISWNRGRACRNSNLLPPAGAEPLPLLWASVHEAPLGGGLLTIFCAPDPISEQYFHMA